MTKSRASRTVVKQEYNESALRWFECKAILSTIWNNVPAIPCAGSRRAWAIARGVDPQRVHVWFGDRKAARARKGIKHHPEDNYSLPLEDAVAEHASSSVPPVPPLDSLSSPRHLSMSSPLPQTPMDMNIELPITSSSIPLFEQPQITHSKSVEVCDPTSHPFSMSSDTHPDEVDLAVKTELVGKVTLADSRVPGGRNKRKIALPVAPEIDEGPSKRSRHDTKNLEPTTKTAQPKKRGRPKKVSEVKATDQKNESSASLQPQSGVDPTGSMMVSPPGLPAGFCTSPYFAYINPAMTFDGSIAMATAPNLPPQSFGNIMYNPFTGAPLYNNVPAYFSNFSNQPSQPILFNGRADTGFLRQMLSQIPTPGNAIIPPMDQASFFGNPQNYPAGMPANVGMGSQAPPEPIMSMTDFLNEPLEAGWTYPNFST
ncbi:unnamed protein product [Rhizoctonia solani]|uniref:Homeobox domain-containing protein n=1 Tax=Rhizoctonia solani TaxID=456999 RepID=A0A8H3GYF1_9AGAM|nr:unnamed protein product [Rhizoctonia solani]